MTAQHNVKWNDSYCSFISIRALLRSANWLLGRSEGRSRHFSGFSFFIRRALGLLSCLSLSYLSSHVRTSCVCSLGSLFWISLSKGITSQSRLARPAFGCAGQWRFAWVNLELQPGTVQTKGFSPVCNLWWVFSWPLWTKALSQLGKSQV